MLRRRAAKRRAPGLVGRMAHAAEVASAATPLSSSVSGAIDTHAQAPRVTQATDGSVYQPQAQQAQPTMRVPLTQPTPTAPVPAAEKL
jgi:hypothetical protein